MAFEYINEVHKTVSQEDYNRSIIDKLDKAKIQDAKEQAAMEDLYIIVPNGYDELGELNLAWDNYNGMTKPFRRKADWLCIQYFGIDNKTIYDTMMSKLLAIAEEPPKIVTDTVAPSEQPLYEGYMSAGDTVDVEEILRNMTIEEQRNAAAVMHNYSDETGFPVILPSINTSYTINELEKLWDEYNLLPHKKRREVDWKMQETYGFSTMRSYEYIKKHLMNNTDVDTDTFEIPYIAMESTNLSSLARAFRDLPDNSYGRDVKNTAIDLMEGLTNLADYGDIGLAGQIIDDTIGDNELVSTFDGMNINMIEDIMYTPDEMIDMGTYEPQDGVLNEDKDEWFAEYCLAYKYGITSEEYQIKENARINTLTQWNNGYIQLSNEQVFKLGWNPYIPFNGMNRMKANHRIRSILESTNNQYKVVDISNMRVSDTLPITEAAEGKKKIFIVLEEGKTPVISTLIRKVTDTIYSHALLAFDSSLEKMYSYGVFGSISERKFAGGLTCESIKTKKKDSRIKVYSIFVNDDTYWKLKKNVEYFVENAKKTSYAGIKLFTYLFNIPTKSDKPNLICSEFVDRMLKLADLDITGKQSSMVSPGEIDNTFKRKKKIYTVFSDFIERYNKVKIDRALAALEKRAKVIDESNMLSNQEASYYMRHGILEELHFVNENKLPYLNKRVYNKFVKDILDTEDKIIPAKHAFKITMDMI